MVLSVICLDWYSKVRKKAVGPNYKAQIVYHVSFFVFVPSVPFIKICSIIVSRQMEQLVYLPMKVLTILCVNQ